MYTEKTRQAATLRLVIAVSVWLVIGALPLATTQSHAQSCDDPFSDEGSLNFNPRGWSTDFCHHTVPYGEIQSGGPPRDGIPPIDNPTFVSVAEADGWINEKEPVISLRVGEEVRAYPLQILTWHEIVNDTVGEMPVAVTFCPLCYAAIVFVRPEIEGEQLTFGTTGNLRHSDLIMWDRETESWWQQFSGKAIVGSLTGTSLESVPAPLVSWKEFRERHPDASVLSKETGHARRYGENPYVGYDDASKPPWLFEGPVGKALRPMERVLGVEVGDDAKAYRLRDLQEAKVIGDTVSKTPVSIFWTEEAVSALDKRIISDSKRIGSVGVFESRLDGRVLTFESSGKGRFRDHETGSLWNIFGESTKGPHVGRTLTPLVHHNTFWFVWSTFRGDSPLYD